MTQTTSTLVKSDRDLLACNLTINFLVNVLICAEKMKKTSGIASDTVLKSFSFSIPGNRLVFNGDIDR